MRKLQLADQWRDAGALAELPSSAVHVLFIDHLHADKDTLEVKISLTTRERHTGLSRATVTRALATLQAAGIDVLDAKGGPGRTSRRRLASTPEIAKRAEAWRAGRAAKRADFKRPSTAAPAATPTEIEQPREAAAKDEKLIADARWWAVEKFGLQSRPMIAKALAGGPCGQRSTWAALRFAAYYKTTGEGDPKGIFIHALKNPAQYVMPLEPPGDGLDDVALARLTLRELEEAFPKSAARRRAAECGDAPPATRTEIIAPRRPRVVINDDPPPEPSSNGSSDIESDEDEEFDRQCAEANARRMKRSPIVEESQ